MLFRRLGTVLVFVGMFVFLLQIVSLIQAEVDNKGHTLNWQHIPSLPPLPGSAISTEVLLNSNPDDVLNISNSPTPSDGPCLVVDADDSPYFVWWEDNDIYFNVLGGTPVNISNSPVTSQSSVIGIDKNETIHVVWDEDTAGTYQSIFYAYSSDGGETCAI